MGKGLGHGDRVPVNGMSAFMREAPEGSLPLLPCEPTGKGQWSLPRKRPSPDMEPAGANLRRCSFLYPPNELRTGGLLLSRCSAEPGSCPGLLASPPISNHSTNPVSAAFKPHPKSDQGFPWTAISLVHPTIIVLYPSLLSCALAHGLALTVHPPCGGHL